MIVVHAGQGYNVKTSVAYKIVKAVGAFSLNMQFHGAFARRSSRFPCLASLLLWSHQA